MTFRLFPTTSRSTWFLVVLCLSIALVVGSVLEIKRKNYRLTTSSILSSVLSFLLPSCTLVATTCPLRPIRPLNPESPILLLEKFRYRPNFAIYNHRGTVMYMNRYADAQ
ncbi:hypothetical protein Gasu2_13400 [Galdieria sulphuraria]|nr:hypothetical protein Gasu2_13400 [Galdieria sulphuraria]